MKKRSKNLDETIIEEIIEILEGWVGKLSWELLVERVEQRLNLHYTRQTLFNYEHIKQAFSVHKKRISNSDGEVREVEDLSLRVALQQIARLEAENLRLKALSVSDFAAR